MQALAGESVGCVTPGGSGEESLAEGKWLLCASPLLSSTNTARGKGPGRGKPETKDP